MSKEVFTGWRTVRPGKCPDCGCDDDWSDDGRGNVLCSCQACPDCGELSAYGFHGADCPALAPKTRIGLEVAARAGLDVVNLRLSTFDPDDLSGLPVSR